MLDNINSNYQHRGQSIPKFDYEIYKGIAKSFRCKFIRNFTNTLDKIMKYGENLSPAFIH